MTPEQKKALQRAAIRRAEASRRGAGKNGIPEGATLLATTDDNGRVYEMPDGKRGFVGAALSSTNPETVARILEGATPAAVSRATMQEDLGAQGGSRARAALSGAAQGATFGYSDELAGAVAAGGALLTGGDPGQAYQDATSRARGMINADAEAYPGTTVAANIAGAVGTGLAAPLKAVTSVRGAATLGAGTAALDASGRADGSLEDRALDAVKAAPVGFLFSGAVSALGKSVPKFVRTAFARAEQRPSLEALKAAKNRAYAAVRRSGEVFDETETTELGVKILDLAGDVYADADPQATAVLKMVEKRAGKVLDLNELDKLRQSLWARYNRGNEPVIIDMIGEIDALISSRAGSSELMAAARDANARYSKATLLEGAFRRARLQTAATGSGGNILNKYKQAVVSIITKPHEAKWFSADELKLMEDFVYGNRTENALRKLGKLSPNGNGLMTALNVYAASVDPTLLAITGGASVAKNRADISGMRGSDRLVDAMATGIIPPPPQPTRLNALASTSGVGANLLLNALAP